MRHRPSGFIHWQLVCQPSPPPTRIKKMPIGLASFLSFPGCFPTSFRAHDSRSCMHPKIYCGNQRLRFAFLAILYFHAALSLWIINLITGSAGMSGSFDNPVTHEQPSHAGIPYTINPMIEPVHGNIQRFPDASSFHLLFFNSRIMQTDLFVTRRIYRFIMSIPVRIESGPGFIIVQEYFRGHDFRLHQVRLIFYLRHDGSMDHPKGYLGELVRRWGDINIHPLKLRPDEFLHAQLQINLFLRFQHRNTFFQGFVEQP